jgi:hypothetical protein
MVEMNERTMNLIKAYHWEYVSNCFPDDPNEAIESILNRMDDFVQGFYEHAYPEKGRPVLAISISKVPGKSIYD